MHIFQAQSDHDIHQARALFEEYQSGLGISLCFQNFDQELKNLPGDYAAPDGRLLLAIEDDQLAGCIALRKLAPGVCEMKRLFVRPAFRGKRLGKVLVESIIDEARKLGYTHMRLDTLPGRMDKAIALYQSMGFVDIGPYCENPVEGAKFMELNLATRETHRSIDTCQRSKLRLRMVWSKPKDPRERNSFWSLKTPVSTFFTVAAATRAARPAGLKFSRANLVKWENSNETVSRSKLNSRPTHVFPARSGLRTICMSK